LADGQLAAPPQPFPAAFDVRGWAVGILVEEFFERARLWRRGPGSEWPTGAAVLPAVRWRLELGMVTVTPGENRRAALPVPGQRTGLSSPLQATPAELGTASHGYELLAHFLIADGWEMEIGRVRYEVESRDEKSRPIRVSQELDCIARDMRGGRFRYWGDVMWHAGAAVPEVSRKEKVEVGRRRSRQWRDPKSKFPPEVFPAEGHVIFHILAGAGCVRAHRLAERIRG